MKRLRKLLVIFSFSLLVSACLEPYTPPELKDNVDVLVVDGFLNTNGTCTVTLTKATALSSASSTQHVTNAAVKIEREDGTVYDLIETDEGVYTRNDIPVSYATRYRLKFTTSSDDTYISDYVKPKESPAIDSVTWRPGEDGIEILVNTHDDANNTRYYQWYYKQTWEYNATYYSYFIRNGGTATPRKPEESIYTCWSNELSQLINIESTKRLSQDVVSNFPIAYIPKGSQKLFKRFSIMVEQRALSKEAYDFWLQLQKTTEGLGGLFDPLPAQVLGNVHHAETNESILGYFSSGSTSAQRIFISINDLPDRLRVNKTNPECEQTSIGLDELATLYGAWSIVDVFGTPFPLGYFVAPTVCVDCRTSGGDLKKPDFW